MGDMLSIAEMFISFARPKETNQRKGQPWIFITFVKSLRVDLYQDLFQ